MPETVELPVRSTTTQPGQPNQTLSGCVAAALQNYFSNLGGQLPTNLYEMVQREVESPLLEAVMRYVRGNQSRAAILLGLSRGTLRKMLKTYDLLD